jgi:hypothetical protein
VQRTGGGGREPPGGLRSLRESHDKRLTR